MAKFSAKRAEALNSLEDDSSLVDFSPQFNPFPGLRPFSSDESHLFFGREGQVDEMLAKLARNRSVSVLGSSGSGKSSLIYSGLIPALYGGFVTQTGPNWNVVQSRPGLSPIENLTSSIIQTLKSSGQLTGQDQQVQRATIISVLRNSAFGLIEIAQFLQKRTGDNICILIDQFEEIFRYRRSGGDESKNDVTHFVNLILQALSQREVPVYVVLSMRSDFINDCTEFPGLTEVLNLSNYVVPIMSRDQKRKAIEGPVSVGGGRISRRLVKRLLTDLEDIQDSLPILQHALMRSWDYWVQNREEGEPIDIRHYNAVGRIEQALSQHANEAYDELTPRDKEIAEAIFKNITEKNQDNLRLRRPGRINEIGELANATEAEVVTVVNQFRKPGRSFLMPGIHVELSGDSIVEISHESMMRIWTRLSGWVEDEFESSQMYKRLADASAMYQIGRTGLWRPPDLQLALNWQKKQNPTRIWAQRYDPAFERAIVFLDTSRITYEAELKNQEMLQKRMLRRARVTNIILSLAFLVAMVFFFFGLTQRIEAEHERDNATIEAENAMKASAIAETKTKEAEEALAKVRQQEQLLNENNNELMQSLLETEAAKRAAEQNANLAKEQERLALMAQKEEAAQRQKAEEARQDAITSRDQAHALFMLTVAQSMEAKAETMDDAQLSGLLAMQGYIFHSRYEGKKYDPYVFRGLYYAAAKINGYHYNAVIVPGNLRNRMNAIAISTKSGEFYVTGTDGRIFSASIHAGKVDNQIGMTNHPNRTIAVSFDENYIAVGTDSSTLQVYNLKLPISPVLIPGHKTFVNDVKFLPDNSGFISAGGDNTIRFNNHKTGESRLLVTLPFDLKTIAINSTGNILVGVSTIGKVVQVDLTSNKFSIIRDEAPNRLLSIAYHPSQNKIAYGLEVIGDDNQIQRGLVKILDLNTNRIKELGGHRAGVAAVEYSPDGLLMASAGLDKKLQMWVVDKEEDLPIVMDNNNGNIWSIGFSKDSNHLLASCNNGEIRIWPTDPKMLADIVCPSLTRSMTMEEWSIYVGENIDFEKTCEK
jgi:ABC-type oligopeptide transport system ATPase subunit